MPHSLLLAVAGIVIALGSARPAAADLEVLLKSGDVAPDGRVLSAFSSPLASSKTKVAFLGITSAVITESGGTFTTVVKTGDPLPAPLTGTFDAFFDLVINDSGKVAFRASLNSPSADAGLFYCCDAGMMVPVALTGGTSGTTGSIRNPPDMNNNGDVVYEVTTTQINLWEHATFSTFPIAAVGNASPGGGTFTRFGDRPVVNDARQVAFEAEVSGGPEGIFSKAPFAPVVACALEDAASPIAGGTYDTFAPTGAVSINAAGKIAFTSNIQQAGPDTSGVFLCDPSVASVVTIAKEGDLVSGVPITAFDDEFVGVDAADSVAFEPIASGRRLVIASGSPPFTALTTFASGVSEFAPRLTTLGQVI